MTDATEETTVTTTDDAAEAAAPAPSDMVQVQIIAAGASYFSREPVRGATGDIRTAPNGEEIYTESRHQALFGETITLTSYEAERLKAEGIARDPSDAPLRTKYPAATPFGVPMRDEDDVLRAYEGPIMGDPAPQGGLSDLELGAKSGGLTPEQASEIEMQARRAAGDDGEPFNIDEAAEDEISAKVATLDVNGTLALAKTDDGSGYDEARAHLVLTAELERDNPRVGVTEPLEKVIDG